MAIPLYKLLERVPDEVREQMDRIRKQAQASIRDELRKETGFMLSRKDARRKSRNPFEGAKIPIKVVAGMPAPLRTFEFPDEMALAIAISPHRREMKLIRESIEGIKSRGLYLPSNERAKAIKIAWDEHVPNTHELIVRLLDVVHTAHPVSRMLAVNEDVLGVYKYKVSEQRGMFDAGSHESTIELYWAVIGLFAGMLGVPVDMLTIVVLTHELAHGYTHLGADIDGDRWDSYYFSTASHEIKEGLAQYYTHIITDKLSLQYPELHETYLEFLVHQPDAYKTHMDWVRNYRPEEVRYAMLACRRGERGDLEYFNAQLENAKKQLRAKTN